MIYKRPKISPTLIELKPGDIEQFTLISEEEPSGVLWSASCAPGADSGEIDQEGLYTSPEGGYPTEVCIEARLDGSSVPFVWSTVILGNPDQIYSMQGFWNRQGE